MQRSDSFKMDNELFAASLPISDQNHVVFNAVSPHMFQFPFMQSSIVDQTSNEHLMGSNHFTSSVQQEESLAYIPTNTGAFPTSRAILRTGNPFPDVFCGDNNMMETSLPSTSLSKLFTSTVTSHESLFNISNSYRTQDDRHHDELIQVISTVHPSYHVTGNNFPVWNTNHCALKSENFSLTRNELSLSLSSYQPPDICMPGIQDHCSEKSCSGVTQVTSKDSDELSLYCGPSSSVQFSDAHLRSRYLRASESILAEIFSYALGNSDEIDDSVSCSRDGGFSLGFDKSQETIEQLVQEENNMEKTELLTMLQTVNDRCKQYLDHIQNIVTTFRDTTNSSGPQMLAQFALKTLTTTYKNMREKITHQILLGSQDRSSSCPAGKERAFELSFIKKQWDMQQLGRKDQQSWRPQRGLPERSVSVLRAWMFQNFLHPYPKDDDKHLLALQSGLTRSQVSNWFINARVRLWKPMIEEMYSEIKKHETGEIRDTILEATKMPAIRDPK